MIFGVITTENLAQAEARAGEKSNNKGYEAALVGLQMVALLSEIEKA